MLFPVNFSEIGRPTKYAEGPSVLNSLQRHIHDSNFRVVARFEWKELPTSGVLKFEDSVKFLLNESLGYMSTFLTTANSEGVVFKFQLCHDLELKPQPHQKRDFVARIARLHFLSDQLHGQTQIRLNGCAAIEVMNLKQIFWCEKKILQGPVRKFPTQGEFPAMRISNPVAPALRRLQDKVYWESKQKYTLVNLSGIQSGDTFTLVEVEWSDDMESWSSHTLLTGYERRWHGRSVCAIL